MNKADLAAAVQAVKTETGNALQTIYNAMNQGQQKQIVKDKAVRELFARYGVEYKEE